MVFYVIMKDTAARFEEKKMSNMPSSADSLMDMLEQSGGLIQSAFDNSDIAFMRSQSDAKRLADIQKQKTEEEELLRFRLNSMHAAQTKSNSIVLAPKEKRKPPVKSIVPVKITAKKRRIEKEINTNSDEGICIGHGSVVESESGVAEGVQKGDTTAAVGTSGALGLLASVYSDSD